MGISFVALRRTLLIFLCLAFIACEFEDPAPPGSYPGPFTENGLAEAWVGFQQVPANGYEYDPNTSEEGQIAFQLECLVKPIETAMFDNWIQIRIFDQGEKEIARSNCRFF